MAPSPPDASPGAKPITELPNDLSYYIDVSSPLDIVRIFRSVDGQIYSGFASYPSLFEKEVLENIDHLTEMVAEIVAFPKDSAVIISGAGSSGRIAFLVARAANAALQQKKLPPCFHYLIAGGEEALLKSQEGAEDDAEAAVEDLKKVLGGGARGKPYSRFVYIGVSAGLTATYVAAQLKHVASHKYGAAALIGFNVAAHARATKAEGSSFSFSDVIKDVQAKIRKEDIQRFYLITPVVGPEAITGSTRLKAGTATKLLLEAVVTRALAKVLRLPCLGQLPGSSKIIVEPATKGKGKSPDPKAKIGWQKASTAPLVEAATTLEAYEAVHRATYLEAGKIAELMELVSRSWKDGGSVYYIGKPSLGLVGLLDASEQVPTFGADPSALQAFVTGDWEAVEKAFERKPPPPTKQPKVDPDWDDADDDDDDDDDDEEDDGDDDSDKESAPGESQKEGRTAEEEKEEAEKAAAQRRKDLFASVTVDHFLKNVLPKAKPTDTVVLLDSATASEAEEFPRALVSALLDRIAGKGLNLALLTVHVSQHDRLLLSTYPDAAANGDATPGAVAGKNASWKGVPQATSNGTKAPQSVEKVFAEVADVVIKVVLPAAAAAPMLPAAGVDTFAEHVVKIILNAASTGAQALQGKVYGNKMIDLRVSNEKLFRRAAGLVAELSGVELPKAKEALLQIAEYYAVKGKKTAPTKISDLISVLAKHNKVVPAAVLVSSGKYKVDAAVQAASRERSVRPILGAKAL